MNISKLYREFFESERSGGLVLIACSLVSILLANSFLSSSYLNFWHYKLAGLSLSHWINDGIMTLFFLLIGLELEREIYTGELSSLKKASLPIFAAIGGMLIPAGLYLLVNYNVQFKSGAGIPMATDIAFALGILSLLGKKVPLPLKIFLTALAVIDDLGAILIIAFFYSSGIVWFNLIFSLGIFGILLILNRLKVFNLISYIIGGVFMWYFMLHSGVHATITGVLLAFAVPFGRGDKKSPSYILQHLLHKPVAFIILPVFALANTAITLGPNLMAGFSEHYMSGIVLGLVVGKPLGITFFSFVAVMFGFSALPTGLSWKHITGAGLLGGIGFTMSIFITLLAFSSNEVINGAKIAIILASLMAGIAGFIWLKHVLKR
jgi:NhaA family Na+:H+ antiporter